MADSHILQCKSEGELSRHTNWSTWGRKRQLFHSNVHTEHLPVQCGFGSWEIIRRCKSYGINCMKLCLWPGESKNLNILTHQSKIVLCYCAISHNNGHESQSFKWYRGRCLPDCAIMVSWHTSDQQQCNNGNTSLQTSILISARWTMFRNNNYIFQIKQVRSQPDCAIIVSWHTADQHQCNNWNTSLQTSILISAKWIMFRNNN